MEMSMNFMGSRFSRRGFIVGAASGWLSFYSAPKTAAQIEVYGSGHQAGPIRSVRPLAPEMIANNHGDTWVAAWADDNNLYSPSNDGSGMFEGPDPFDNMGQLPPVARQKLYEDKRSNIAFNRLEGSDPAKLHGIKVNPMTDYSIQDRITTWRETKGLKLKVGADGRTWKSSGCASIDGVLYWVIARHKYGETSGDSSKRQTAQNASIIKSTDFGKTWTRSAEKNLNSPMFPGSHFATPYFIDYGRRKISVDGVDRYIYCVSNNGFWDNGDSMILGRVLRDRIGLLDGSDWEFYSGGDGLNSANWMSDPGGAKPILERPGKLGETGAVYLPDRRRYMMIGWYYPLGGGKLDGASTTTVWDFYEAPRPWGPWTQIHSHTFSPEGYYCPGICPKFQSAGRVYALTAGDFTNRAYYRLTVVPIDLV
jgi:Domain of unknown function (DUF4185)